MMPLCGLELRKLKGKGSAVERRQFDRESLGGDDTLRVSLFLKSESLVFVGRTEEFELEAKAVDISRGGIGVRLSFEADLMMLQPGENLTVRLQRENRQLEVPAQVAHFEQEQGVMGLRFIEPLNTIGF